MFPWTINLFIITLSYGLFTGKPVFRREIIHCWFGCHLNRKKTTNNGTRLAVESFPSTNVHVVENNIDLEDWLHLTF